MESLYNVYKVVKEMSLILHSLSFLKVSIDETDIQKMVNNKLTISESLKNIKKYAQPGDNLVIVTKDGVIRPLNEYIFKYGLDVYYRIYNVSQSKASDAVLNFCRQYCDVPGVNYVTCRVEEDPCELGNLYYFVEIGCNKYYKPDVLNCLCFDFSLPVVCIEFSGFFEYLSAAHVTAE